jgi:Undecaprenyl-phosphate glucose phosphotransferase
MDGQIVEPVRQVARRNKIVTDTLDTACFAPPRPDQPAIEAKGTTIPRNPAARRYGLLATELGFRLTDLCTVALMAWIAGAADDHGTRASIGLLPAGVVMVLTNIVFSVRGIYRDWPIFLRHLDIERLMVAWWHVFGCWLVVMLLLDAGIALVSTPGAAADLMLTFQPRALALFFFGGMVSIAAGRLALIQILSLTGIHTQVRQRTYILGCGPVGQKLAQHFAREDDPEMEVLGFFDDGEAESPPATMGRLVLLGGVDSLVRLIQQGRVDTVLVTTAWSAADRINAIMRCLAALPVRVGAVPEEIPFGIPHRVVRSASGLPILQVCEQRLSDCAQLLKKMEDMVLAPLFLLLVAPVMVAIAVAIKLDSPGPVLFSQRRCGNDNRVISVHKFRTMYAQLSDEDCEQQTVRDDHRVTRVGKIIRRLSLDELPQLFNVLAGEMSIVGPRPHAMSTKADGHLFEDAVATYMARHRVLPGITGWAQVNGWRGETDTLEKIAKRVEHDLYYIGNWTLALDLLILVRTVRILFKGENAY